MISQECFLACNRRGLIQAPDESEDEFFRRCHLAVTLPAPSQSLLANELFDIDPDWVEIMYDNKGLHMWEGGCTWIEGDQVSLQLRKAFLSKGSYLGYTREEIIAHELVHVVRGAFKEPIFEEILAYQTSSSRFRRFLGPLFRTPKETMILMGSLVVYMVSSFFDIFQLPLFMLLISLGLFGFVRLTRTHIIFYQAKKKLTPLVKQKSVLAVMLRLTDREINRFSKMSYQQITAYAHKMVKNHLRWQQIFSAYFLHLV